MKTITIEIPEGKEAKWVDGVLTLVDEQPKDGYKFKVGDKVILKSNGDIATVVNYFEHNGNPRYYVQGKYTAVWYEKEIESYTPKGITERIKTFDDAYKWCCTNGKGSLVDAYNRIGRVYCGDDDIVAYLQLRIITCALNEGWKPTYNENETRYFLQFELDGFYFKPSAEMPIIRFPKSLVFKTAKLAEYAATQFKDIYMDFCYKRN